MSFSFCNFTNYSLETAIPNLIFQTCSSPRIMEQIQMKISSISRFPDKFLINKSSHNFRSSNDAEIKLGSLSQLEKRNTMAKTYEENAMLKIYDVILLILCCFSKLWPISKNPEVGFRMLSPEFLINIIP